MWKIINKEYVSVILDIRSDGVYWYKIMLDYGRVWKIEYFFKL